jgi:chromosome segregation ATPase
LLPLVWFGNAVVDTSSTAPLKLPESLKMPPRLSQRDLEAILDKGLLQTHSEQKQRITELERSNAILHTVEDRLSALEDEMEVVKSQLAEKTLLVDTLQKKLGEEREKRRGMGKGVTQWKERCEAYEKRWLRLRMLVDEEPELVLDVAPSEVGDLTGCAESDTRRATLYNTGDSTAIVATEKSISHA